MTQQARRAASGGRVSILKADTKSRSQTAKKSQSGTHVPPHKAETVSSQAKKVGSENTEATSRPKTWPLRVLEVSEFCFLMVPPLQTVNTHLLDRLCWCQIFYFQCNQVCSSLHLMPQKNLVLNFSLDLFLSLFPSLSSQENCVMRRFIMSLFTSIVSLIKLRRKRLMGHLTCVVEMRNIKNFSHET